MATGQAASHITEAAILNATFRVGGSTYYLALFTVKPDDSNVGGTEVAGNAYARQAIAFSAPVAKTPSGSEIANSGVITYPVATGNWGTVAYFGLFDAATSGNMLAVDALTPSIVVNDTNQVTFPIGAIIIGVD